LLQICSNNEIQNFLYKSESVHSQELSKMDSKLLVLLAVFGIAAHQVLAVSVDSDKANPKNTDLTTTAKPPAKGNFNLYRLLIFPC
jgi:hypothetical protein